MDLEKLSNAIIDGSFSQTDKVLYNEDFQHYGVLGMKWGVRKDRRRKGESDSDYKDRMARNERLVKQQLAIKARERTQKQEAKRQIKVIREEAKAQQKREKQLLKSQEREKEMEKEVQKQRIVVDKKKSRTFGGVKSMTDQELNDAIQRLLKEQQYKNLKKGPGRKTVDFGASIVGGIIKKTVVDVGSDYAKQKLYKKLKIEPSGKKEDKEEKDKKKKD